MLHKSLAYFVQIACLAEWVRGVYDSAEHYGVWKTHYRGVNSALLVGAE